jgi:hypothetical protein
MLSLRFGIAVSLLVLPIVLAGCQPSVGATATGVVSFNGVPAPAGVQVVFYPQGPKSSSSMAITNAEGKYDLWFNASIRGVMPGENVVSLSIDDDLNASRGVAVTDSLRAIKLPARYRGPKSPLVKTVQPGVNVIDIDVTLSDPPKAD